MRRAKIVLGPVALAELAILRVQVPGLGLALGKLLLQLERFPESAPRENYHGRWSTKRRKAIVGNTGYVLRYRLGQRAELIEVFSIRHGSRRPPR